MTEGEQKPPEKPAYQQLGDELGAALTKWARTGQVTPMQTADMLHDALAQVMALSVKPEALEDALKASDLLLRHKVHHHVARLAHLRQQPTPGAEAAPGKLN